MIWESKNIEDEEERKAHSGFEYEESLIVFGGTTQRLKSFKLKDLNFSITPTNSLVQIIKSKEKDCWKTNLLIPEDLKSSKIPSGRSEHSFISFKTKKKQKEQGILFGGFTGKTYLNDVWIYDPINVAWKPIIFKKDELIPSSRAGHSAIYHENKMYVFGGFNGTTCFNDLWVFDLENLGWLEIKFVKGEDLPGIRSEHTSTLVNREDSTGFDMFVSFGVKIHMLIKTNYSDIWKLDLQTNKWTLMKNIKSNVDNLSRRGHNAISIGKQCILYFGGFKELKYSNEMFIYDITNSKIEEVLSGGITSSNWPPDRSNFLMTFVSKKLIVNGGETVTGIIRTGIWEVDISDIHRVYRVGKSTEQVNENADISKTDLRIIEKTTNQLKKNPDDIKALIERSDAYLRIESYDKVMEDVEKILSLDSSNDSAKINKSVCFFVQKQYKESLMLLQQVFDSNSKDISKFSYENSVKLLEYKAKANLALKKYNEALEDSKLLLEIQNNNKKSPVEAYSIQTDVLFRLGRIEESIKVVTDAIETYKSRKNTFEKLENIKKELKKREGEKRLSQEMLKKAEITISQDNSIELLQKTAKMDPENCMIYSLLSECFLKKNNAEKCKAFAKQCIECDPKYWKGYYLIGNSDLISHNISKAIKYFQLGIERCGENEQLRKAIDDGMKIKEKNEKSKKFFKDGIEYRNEESFKEAITSFSKAIELMDYAVYYYERSLCYIHIDQIDKAMEDASKAIEVEPLSSYGYLAQSEIYCSSKKYKTALACLKKALEKCSDVDPLFKKMKEVQKLLDNLISSETNFQRAKNDFEEYDFDYNLVDSLKELSSTTKRNLETILSFINESISADPTNIDSLVLRSRIYYKLQMFAQCANDCKEIITLDEKRKDSYVLGALAYASVHISLFDKSIELLQNGLKIISNDIEMFDWMDKIKKRQYSFNELSTFIKNGHQFSRENKYQEAIDCFTKALLISKRVDIYYERALNYYHIDKYEESLKDLNLAIEHEPTFPHLHVLIAQNYLKQGKIEEALEECTEALQVTPYNTPLNSLWVQIKLSISLRRVNQITSKLQTVSDIKEKIILVSEILSIIPNSCKHLLMRCKLYFENQKYHESRVDAEKLISQILTGIPTNEQIIEAYYYLGQSYFKMGKYYKSYIETEKGAKYNYQFKKMKHHLFIDLLQEISKAENLNKEAELYYKDADRSFKQKEYLQAYEYISKSISLSPKTSKYYYLRSRINLNIDNLKQALSDAIYSYNDTPDYDTNVNLIQVYIGCRDFDNAEKYFKEALDGEKNPDNLKELNDLFKEIQENRNKIYLAKEKLKISKTESDPLNTLIQARSLDPQNREILKEYIECLIKKDDLESAEIEVQNLLKSNKDWNHSYDLAIEFYLLYNNEEEIDQALYLSCISIEKFTNQIRFIELLQKTLEKELKIVQFESYCNRFLKYNNFSFQSWKIHDFVIEETQDVVELSDILKEDIDFNVDEKKDTSVFDIYAMKEIKKFVTNFGSGIVEYSKEVLNNCYQYIYKNTLKSIYLSKDLQNLDSHLKSSLFIRSTNEYNEIQKLSKSQVVLDIVTSRYFEIVNDKHPIYKKSSFKNEKEYQEWKETQIKDLNDILSEYNLGTVNLIVLPKTSNDYFNLLSIISSALYSHDMNDLETTFEREKKIIQVPSENTKKIIDSICKHYNFGGGFIQKLLIFNGMVSLVTRKKDPSLEFVHTYLSLIDIVKELIKKGSILQVESDLLFKSINLLLGYIQVIQTQYYKTINERMRKMIIFSFKAFYLIQIIKIFVKQEKVDTLIINERIVEKGLGELFELFTKEVFPTGKITPKTLTLFSKSLSKYIEKSKIYFISMYTVLIDFISILTKIFDRGMKNVLIGFKQYDGRSSLEEILDLYETLTNLYKLLVEKKKVTTPSFFQIFRPSIESWINEQKDAMKKAIYKAIEIDQWEIVIQGINYTSCVTDVYSSFETTLEQFDNILHTIRGKTKDETLSEEFYIRIFSQNVSDSIFYFCELISDHFKKETDSKKKLYCINNLLESLNLTKNLTDKISSRVDKLDDIFDILYAAEVKIKQTYQYLIIEFLKPYHLLYSVPFFKELTSQRLCTYQRIQKFQNKLIENSKFDETEVAKLTSKLIHDISEAFIMIQTCILNPTQLPDFYFSYLMLLCCEIKENTYSNDNKGPYKNLTNQQVENIKISFQYLSPFFEKLVERDISKEIQFILEILEITLLDTDRLINRYLDLVEELSKKIPKEIENQKREFIYGYMIKRDDHLSNSTMTSESMIYKALKKQKEIQKELFTHLKTKVDQSISKEKQEIDLLEAQEKHQKQTNGIDNAHDIIQGAKQIKAENIELIIKMTKTKKSIDNYIKYNKELNEFLTKERKLVLSYHDLKNLNELSQDEYKKIIKELHFESLILEEEKKHSLLQTPKPLKDALPGTIFQHNDQYEGTPILCFYELNVGHLYLSQTSILFYSQKLSIKLPINGKTFIDDIHKSKWFTKDDDSIEVLLKSNINEKIYTFYRFKDFNSSFNIIQSHLEKIIGKKLNQEMKISKSKLQQNTYPVSQTLIRKFNLTQNLEIYSSYFCKDDESSISGTLYLFKDRIIFDPSNSFGEVNMNLLFRSFFSIEKPSEKEGKYKIKIKDEMEKVRIFSDVRQREILFQDLIKLIQSEGIELAVDDDSAVRIKF